MALNSSYDTYNTSPYSSNSYGTGAYGVNGSYTPPSQQNAFNQSAGANYGGGSSGSSSSGGGNYSSFSDAANSWAPRTNQTGSYDQQSPSSSPYGGSTSPYDQAFGSYLQQPPQSASTGGSRQFPQYNYPQDPSSDWQVSGGAFPVNSGPHRPGVGGSIGQPPSQFPVIPNEQPYTPPIIGRQPGFGQQQPSGGMQLSSGPQPINGPLGGAGGPTPTGYGSPSRPGVTGSIGNPASAPQDKSAFTDANGQFNTLGYYQQWLPSLTQDQLNQYWTEGAQGQSQGQTISDWYGSRFNSDGTPKAGYGNNGSTPSSTNPGNMAGQYEPNQSVVGQQPWTGARFVQGYGWTQTPEEFAQVTQQLQQQQSQGGNGGNGNGTPPPAQPVATRTPTDPTVTFNPPADYAHSNITPPAPVQFPTAPGTSAPIPPGSTATPAVPVAPPGAAGSPAAPGTPGTPGATGTPQSFANSDIASYLRSTLAPQFQQEQSDLQRQMLATGAQLGDTNSGGLSSTIGKEQARLSANQGSRLTDYLTQASEAEKNRQEQTYQIDTNAAVAKMQDETAQYGIRTNDDLQRYLNGQNNALAKYGIDKNDVLQRYIAIQNANGQASAANAAFNAAALQAATQQSIAAMNNKTAQQTSQNQYNLGVLGINADNYRNDSNNLLGYLNLLLQSNPQAPVPQIPGVVGYGP